MGVPFSIRMGSQILKGMNLNWVCHISRGVKFPVTLDPPGVRFTTYLVAHATRFNALHQKSREVRMLQNYI